MKPSQGGCAWHWVKPPQTSVRSHAPFNYNTTLSFYHLESHPSVVRSFAECAHAHFRVIPSRLVRRRVPQSAKKDLCTQDIATGSPYSLLLNRVRDREGRRPACTFQFVTIPVYLHWHGQVSIVLSTCLKLPHGPGLLQTCCVAFCALHLYRSGPIFIHG